VLFGLMLFTGRPARADEPFVKVTACDAVQVAGQSAFRLTLSIMGKLQFYDTAVISPATGFGDASTCDILEASPPAGWKVFRIDDGTMLFYGPPVDQGQYLDGFQITLSSASCCEFVNLSNFLLLDSPGFGNVCFHDCLATPSRATSWGRMKAYYR
jgi:hypothetical protein